MSRLLLIAFLFSPFVAIADERSERYAAAVRYEAVADMDSMLNDAFAEMSLNVPIAKREKFIVAMNKSIDRELLRDMTIESMVAVFTADELNALADFYGGELGQSITGKFGIYMSSLMPMFNRLLIEASEEAR